MNFTPQEEMYGKVIQKAWEDADFKARLVANPLATLQAITGKSFRIPEGKTLVVCDQTDDSTIYINIPPYQSADEVELTDAQLEAVAGGAGRPGLNIDDLFGPLVYNPFEKLPI
ncbi:MAG: NHLP leader peptide family RiPP precursor [Haliscomenobacter sp.]|nr:NHLP leader peptide family RiPP precursor [Haliscomenobacter sp.]MBK7477377.1 NHLP leader peptide family RiPP precursor [Haliscomenobacter sp.]MBK8880104.1 NHLP leader peptide family RiPP precursor [Haliscomenobacter sp.]